MINLLKLTSDMTIKISPSLLKHQFIFCPNVCGLTKFDLHSFYNLVFRVCMIEVMVEVMIEVIFLQNIF